MNNGMFRAGRRLAATATVTIRNFEHMVSWKLEFVGEQINENLISRI
jgi:hypothetical protein